MWTPVLQILEFSTSLYMNVNCWIYTSTFVDIDFTWNPRILFFSNKQINVANLKIYSLKAIKNCISFKDGLFEYSIWKRRDTGSWSGKYICFISKICFKIQLLNSRCCGLVLKTWQNVSRCPRYQCFSNCFLSGEKVWTNLVW